MITNNERVTESSKKGIKKEKENYWDPNFGESALNNFEFCGGVLFARSFTNESKNVIRCFSICGKYLPLNLVEFDPFATFPIIQLPTWTVSAFYIVTAIVSIFYVFSTFAASSPLISRISDGLHGKLNHRQVKLSIY